MKKENISQIKVRKAELSEIDDLLMVEKECFEYNKYIQKDFSEMLKDKSLYLVCVAEIDNIISGYIILKIVLNECEIIKIAVLNKFRKLGIGTKLLKETFSMINEKCNIVFLEVDESNMAALMLYEKFGFKKFNIRKNYYQNGHNAVEMKLELQLKD